MQRAKFLSCLLLILANIDLVHGKWFCTKNLCENGGTCKPGLLYDVCKCTPSWKGRRCEIKVLPCKLAPCKNGGKCEDVDDKTFKCTCGDDFFGDTCEEKKKCNAPLDILFVVDTSSWQYWHNFKLIKEFILKVIEWMEISKSAVQVGMLPFTYEKYTNVLFYPHTYGDFPHLKDGIIKKLQKSPPRAFIGHEGHLTRALQIANRKVFPTSSGRPKAVVILSAQKPLDNIQEFYDAWQKLEKKDVNVVTVQLLPSPSQLLVPQRIEIFEDIAKKGKLIKSKFPDLNNHVLQLVHILCKNINPTDKC
ncbi:von Willebrand factor A domain-containing protein 2-like isoform X2 [Xenia sp. Carnegie-2017]|nr:von Willebrand factor A domain-containing protein 2-like isoform X2 [Xenia sp. Carnegie-2017]